MEEAITWFYKDELILLGKGQRVLAADAKGFVRRSGAYNRIIEMTRVGVVDHATMTMGH